MTENTSTENVSIEHTTTEKDDGDTWVEAKAILDDSTGETRSYFWSRKTQKRVWDKPPANAGRVIYWEQIAQYDTSQVPQKMKDSSPKATPTSSVSHSPKTNVSKSPTPSDEKRASPDEKKASPPSKSLPSSGRKSPHRSRSPRPGLRKGSSPKMPQSPKVPKSNGETKSTSKQRKEVIASLFVMAPQGSLNMGQVTGALDQVEKTTPRGGQSTPTTGQSTPRERRRITPLDLRQSLPPPDGDEYDYEITHDDDHSKKDDHAKKDKFKAKPSAHVKSGGINLKTRTRGDGDLWVEAQVLLNEETGETRSYFYSKNTQKRVWDEPPSGAGKVIRLQDVKRVYMRNKSHHWRKDHQEEKTTKGKKHAGKQTPAYKSSGHRQKPVKPIHLKSEPIK